MANPEFLGMLVLGIGTIAGAYLTLAKIKAGFKKEIESEIEAAIENARSIAEADIREFNLKLEAVSRDIQSLEAKVDRDIEYVKTIYNNEIKVLGDKIENLREEVKNQHAQLVGLLTKMITDK